MAEVDPAQLEEILSVIRQSDVPDPNVQRMVHEVREEKKEKKKTEEKGRGEEDRGKSPLLLSVSLKRVQ